MVKKAGFMLLELLIALAVLSCSAAATVAYHAQTSNAQRDVKERMRALAYAAHCMEQTLYTSHSCEQSCDGMSCLCVERAFTPHVSAESWIELCDAQIIEVKV